MRAAMQANLFYRFIAFTLLRPRAHRHAAGGGYGAKGDSYNALLALLTEAAALLLHLCSHVLSRVLQSLTFCRSLFTAASMSQEQPWPLEPALAVVDSTRCCAAI